MRSLSFLALTIAASLSAQQSQFKDFGIGFHVAVANPTTDDLKRRIDGKSGAVVGIHVDYKLTKVDTLQLRGDWIWWPQKTTFNYQNGSYTGFAYTETIRTYATDLSYQRTLPQDFFVGVGVGVQRWTFDFHSVFPKSTGKLDAFEHNVVTKPVFHIGGGYKHKLGPVNGFVEMNYNRSNFGPNVPAGWITFGVGVTYSM